MRVGSALDGFKVPAVRLVVKRLVSGVLRLRRKWHAYFLTRLVRRAEGQMRGLAQAYRRRASLLGRSLARHPDLEGRVAASDLVELWRGAEARLFCHEAERPPRPVVDPWPADDNFSFVGMPFNPETAEAAALINRFAWLDILLARGFQLLLASDSQADACDDLQVQARVNAACAAVLVKESAATSTEKKTLLHKLKTIRAAAPEFKLWNVLPGLDSSPRRDAFGPWRQSVEAALITLDPHHKLCEALNQTCVRNVPADIVSGIYIVCVARRTARRTIGRSFCFSAVLCAAWFAAVFAALRTVGIPGPFGSALWLCVLVPARMIVTNMRYRVACMCSGARRVLAPPASSGDFVLFLRAFATDDELVKDRTPFEFSPVTPWLLPAITSFRMRLIKRLGGLRRVIAFADPSHRRTDGAYGLIALPESRWRHNVKRAAAQASLIVVDLNDSRSPSFQWELDVVLRPEYAAKLLFVMPFGPRRLFQTTERVLRRIGDQVIRTEEAPQWPANPPPLHRGFHLLSPVDRYELACRSIRQRLPDVWLPRFSSDSLFLFLEQGRRGRLLNLMLDKKGDPAQDSTPETVDRVSLRREFTMDPYALLKTALFHLGELLLLVTGQYLLFS